MIPLGGGGAAAAAAASCAACSSRSWWAVSSLRAVRLAICDSSASSRASTSVSALAEGLPPGGGAVSPGAGVTTSGVK